MKHVEAQIFGALGVRVRIAASDDALPEKDLFPLERSRFRKLKSPSRRQEWLAGRAALKSLLRSFREEEDTSKLTFPNRRFSVSHSGGRAVAVGVEEDVAAGIGVDFQSRRPVKAETARFYLTDKERSWLMTRNKSLRNKEMLRLWTVKEALFKANPKNRGTILRHYELKNPAVKVGAAVASTREKAQSHYVSLELGDDFLAIAVNGAREGRKPQGEKKQSL